MDELERLQTVLKQQIDHGSRLHYNMELLLLEYDHASLQGNNERSDDTRKRYHDTLDLYLDVRSTIATLSTEIEALRNMRH